MNIFFSQAKESSGGGWFSGWWGGSSKSKSEPGQDQSKSEIATTVKKFEEALTSKEKADLYEVIGYDQDGAEGLGAVSLFPKSYVAQRCVFQLHSLLVCIRDDDMKGDTNEVLRLNLMSVMCHIQRRPSAKNLKLRMTMSSLTVTGLALDRPQVPVMVSSRFLPSKKVLSSSGGRNQSGQDPDSPMLLSLIFEKNPPEDEDGNLDQDKGSLYDRRLVLKSSPLEMVYDAKTFHRLKTIFSTAGNSDGDLGLTNLQNTASAKLNELRESTTLGLQYAIDHHSLVDVDIRLQSPYMIIPHNGDATNGSCAMAIVNLGSIAVKSKQISAEMRDLKALSSLAELTSAFKSSLKDQVYDKFEVKLENVQVLLALPNESWRSQIDKSRSPLFLLEPTSISVLLRLCLIKRDPDLPICKVEGSLDSISVNIADYRLIKLAQILDSLTDSNNKGDSDASAGPLARAESNESMLSALSSLGGIPAGSLSQMPIGGPKSAAIISKLHMKVLPDASEDPLAFVQLTQLALKFHIRQVDFQVSQQGKNTVSDEVIFRFGLNNLAVSTKVRTYDIVGNFEMGSMSCR